MEYPHLKKYDKVELVEEILKKLKGNEGRCFKQDLNQEGRTDGGIMRGFRDSNDAAIQDLINYGFVTEEYSSPLTPALALTPLGYKVAEIGFAKYLELERKNERRIEQRDNYEIQNLKWLVRTRWLPLILSLISIGLSIWALMR